MRLRLLLAASNRNRLKKSIPLRQSNCLKIVNTRQSNREDTLPKHYQRGGRALYLLIHLFQRLARYLAVRLYRRALVSRFALTSRRRRRECLVSVSFLFTILLYLIFGFFCPSIFRVLLFVAID